MLACNHIKSLSTDYAESDTVYFRVGLPFIHGSTREMTHYFPFGEQNFENLDTLKIHIEDINVLNNRVKTLKSGEMCIQLILK